MDSLLRDLKFSARSLLKRPALTIIAIVTLALGLGANLTIFSFVDTFFLRPLPVERPYQLATVTATRNGKLVWEYAYPEYAYFRDHSQSFEALAAHYSTSPLNVVANGDSYEASGAVVSANYFPMLGIKPLKGRFFLPHEDAVPGRDAVAVISYNMWQGRFSGAPSILEKEISLNGTMFKIIGVAPENFRGVSAGFPNDIWIPTMMLQLGYRWCDGLNDLGCRPLTLLGRVASGRTLAEAQAELNLLAGQFAASYPEYKGRGASISPALGVRLEGRNELSYQVKLLMVLTSLLLLIACANVAGLLLVRGATRRKEIVVRLCLGARRGRVVRQLMIESLLLTLAGSALGLLLSFWAKDLLLAFYTLGNGTHDRSYDLSISPRVLAYSFALSLLTAVLSGLMPALSATRQSLATGLKDDGRAQSSRHHRLRSALVVGQVALSLALLVAAGLLMRSARQVRQGANFDPTHVALLRLRPALLKYSPEKAQTFTREVISRLEAVPGVQSVSLATGSGGYAWLSRDEVRVRLPEQAGDRPESELKVEYHEIAPRFFETLKMSLVQGRDFNDGDRPGSPQVIIVNETLARQMWPQGSTLSRSLMVNSQPHQVVGVFKDAQPRNALEAPRPFLYLPVWQDPKQIDSRLVVRVASDPQAMLPLLRREATAVDPKVPITEVMPMTQQMEANYVPVHLTSSVAAYSGVVALLLSMIGLYAVLSFMVSQRTREIGIRMALGAQKRDVLKLVVGQGMSLALIGAALGLVAAFGLSRVLASLLFGVSATDPTTFALIASLLVGVALLACYLPARRAAKVDPLEALRYE